MPGKLLRGRKKGKKGRKVLAKHLYRTKKAAEAAKNRASRYGLTVEISRENGLYLAKYYEKK